MYVCIFFSKNGGHESEDEDENQTENAPDRLNMNNDNESYASSSSLELRTPISVRKFSQTSETDSERGDDKSQMYKSLVMNIIDSESNYVEWLHVLMVVSNLVLRLFIFFNDVHTISSAHSG